MSPRDWRMRVQDILESISNIQEYTKILWRTIQSNLPPLVEQLQSLLKVEDRGEAAGHK